jgi:hypothetical protein
MVHNNQKIFFPHAVLGHFWAPPNGPKKLCKGLHVGKIYGPIAELEKKPITKSIGPFL